MGEALDRGMVLVVSLWDDVATGGELTEIDGHNDESDDFCAAQKTSFGDRNSFAEKGGMKAAYHMDVTDFYGPGSQFSVDTIRPFMIVTRSHATGGELTEIEGHNDESDDFCAAQKTSFGDRNSFAEKGGMKKMGEALDR